MHAEYARGWRGCRASADDGQGERRCRFIRSAACCRGFALPEGRVPLSDGWAQHGERRSTRRRRWVRDGREKRRGSDGASELRWEPCEQREAGKQLLEPREAAAAAVGGGWSGCNSRQGSCKWLMACAKSEVCEAQETCARISCAARALTEAWSGVGSASVVAEYVPR